MWDPEFLCRLKHQCTRDLYWLLAAPYPLNPSESYFRLFPMELMGEIVSSHLGFINKLDRAPDEFISYLATKPTRRLGIYAERLLAFFFESSPHIKLIAYSEQIIRSGETIGEIDFIFEWKGNCYHIEFAVKYFLGTAELNDYNQWIGPSGSDSLGIKLDKVLNRQLPLVEEPEIQDILKGRSCTSYFFLKGKFFLPSGTIEQPKWVNSSAPMGEYARLSEGSALLERCSFQHLVRPNWLSDMTCPLEANVQKIMNTNMEQLIVQLGGVHLVQPKLVNKSNFIVLDEWPTI